MGMTSFSYDPDVEICGRAMLALLECVIAPDIMHLLKRHHLEKIDADQWYPLQSWLDVFQDIIKELGFQGNLDLVAIGMKFVEKAQLPSGIHTLEDALIATNDTYQLNHRNGYAGEMAIIILGPGHLQVIDHTPYPEDFTYGMLYRLARQFNPPGVSPIVRHDDQSPCRQRGDDSCTYDITWGGEKS
jgi:hypothetical protein